ncbi:MAG: Fic family protein [Flavobacteriales bacterium]|nr:Fic family protein [Flavobacteriales bacterium]
MEGSHHRQWASHADRSDPWPVQEDGQHCAPARWIALPLCQPRGGAGHDDGPDGLVQFFERPASRSEGRDRHHRFILIHPFGDGNGRTARLVVNYHLMRHGLMPLVVKSADKSNYLRCLKLADAGDVMPFAGTWRMRRCGRWNWRSGRRRESPLKRHRIGRNAFTSSRTNFRIKIRTRSYSAFNKEALFDMYDMWIGKLFENLIPVLQKFHHLFFGMRHHIHVMEVGGQEPYRTRNSAANVAFIADPPGAVVHRLRDALEKSSVLWTSGAELALQPHLGSFKHLHERAFGTVYHAEVRIDFHHWEVWLDDFNDGDSKRKVSHACQGPYCINLCFVQIDEIAQRYGNAITDHIEHWVAKGGMQPGSEMSSPA